MVAALDGMEQRDSEYQEALDHARACTRCREIDRIYQTLDAALEAAILRPHLSAAFRANLRTKIAGSTSNPSDEWLPDIAYFLGAVAAAAAMAVTTRADSVMVLLVALVGLLGYVFQLAVTSTALSDGTVEYWRGTLKSR
jgi:hypothetical protein